MYMGNNYSDIIDIEMFYVTVIDKAPNEPHVMKEFAAGYGSGGGSGYGGGSSSGSGSGSRGGGGGSGSGSGNSGPKGASNGLLEGVQTALDVAGLVPGLGEIADGINAVIYAANGDYVNASLSLAAMIPIGGQLATAGKLGVKAADVASTAYKPVSGIVKGTSKGIPNSSYIYKSSEGNVISKY